MLKKIITVGAMIMLIATVASCESSKDVRLTLAQDENIELGRGQIVVIELKANPTTGYKWQVLEEANEGVVLQKGEGEYVPSSTAKPIMRGSGGTQIYRFQALNKGEATLVFEYKRPWEEKEPARRYTVQIKVK